MANPYLSSGGRERGRHRSRPGLRRGPGPARCRGRRAGACGASSENSLSAHDDSITMTSAMFTLEIHVYYALSRSQQIIVSYFYNLVLYIVNYQDAQRKKSFGTADPGDQIKSTITAYHCSPSMTNDIDITPMVTHDSIKSCSCIGIKTQ